jgi:allantoinase
MAMQCAGKVSWAGRSKGTDCDWLRRGFSCLESSKAVQVEGDALHHRHKLTPYQGRVLSGVVEKTFLRGNKIFDGGNSVQSRGTC